MWHVHITIVAVEIQQWVFFVLLCCICHDKQYTGWFRRKGQ